MTDFSDWRALDYDASTVQLWVFKKSTTAAKFRAWHVRTDEEVENLFRNAIKSEVSRITEKVTYSHLSQNNENSCLEHSLEDSDGLIALLQAVDVPETENTDAQLKQLKGAVGYLVKFQSGEQTVYAVRKTAPSWKPTVRNKLINAIFVNGELSAVPDESFTFDSYFDFYCLNETIFVASKRAYESTVADKKAYKQSFDDLTVDPEFLSVFSDVEPLKKYVGQNSMQLRRMTVIQQKALYRSPGFSDRVKLVSEARNLGINFDQGGKIAVCQNTAKVVIQVLLDHRLLSEVTETIYDVPDAEAV
ncbi:Kiwa anti-phage protein KwaB-like domain-containing protein [Oceanobacter antarcticus]|uniref:Kiwa anti-phage protein KwaB-like domain-containing protein n=1 Tax=Oceanobacter antarcticus TaxID=3133425 RepID=A0ABW8NPB3_9GAMM